MKQVLIVDDNADHVALLALALRREHEVVTCTDLGSFKAALARRTPDLILMDLHIGLLHASDLMNELHHLHLAVIPVILSSGDADIAEQSRALGCVGFLEKPFSLTVMIETVRRVLGDLRA